MSGITYEELNDSPKYTGSYKELTAVRRWKIAWSDINALYLALFPPVVLGIPQLPARMDGSNVLFADNVQFEPFHPDPGAECVVGTVTNYDFSTGHINSYTNCLATITYKTIPYNISANQSQIYTIKWSTKGEVMRLPNIGLKWGDGTAVQDEALNAGKTITMLEMDINIHRANTLPTAAIVGLIGQVNNSTFFGVGSEGVLFLGAEVQQTVTSDGSAPYEITLKFAQRFIDGNTGLGWNYYFRPSSGNWERLKTKSGNPIFTLGNFNSLL